MKPDLAPAGGLIAFAEESGGRLAGGIAVRELVRIRFYPISSSGHARN
jgi:hypothetical protein